MRKQREQCGGSPNTVWVASFQSGQVRQWAASSRRVWRLGEAVAVGIFRLSWRISVSRAWLQCGQGTKGSSIPLELLMKNKRSNPG